MKISLAFSFSNKKSYQQKIGGNEKFLIHNALTQNEICSFTPNKSIQDFDLPRFCQEMSLYCLPTLLHQIKLSIISGPGLFHTSIA